MILGWLQRNAPVRNRVQTLRAKKVELELRLEEESDRDRYTESLDVR